MGVVVGDVQIDGHFELGHTGEPVALVARTSFMAIRQSMSLSVPWACALGISSRLSKPV